MKKIPVVFIGGLLGNSLYREDTKSFIWKDNLSFYLKSKKNRDALYYHFQKNPEIISGHPVQHFKIVPGIWEKKVGHYLLSEIESLYAEKFSIRPDATLKYCFYDWRLGVEQATLKLKEILPDEPAIFICQSNGGLLLLHLFNQLQEKLKAKAIFMISPPFWGSFEGIRYMRHGFFISNGIKLFSPQESQSFPITWDLLPFGKGEYLNDANFWTKMKWFDWKKSFSTVSNLEKVIDSSYKLHKNLNPAKMINSFPCYIYGSDAGKYINKLKVTDSDINFEDSENEWLSGDSHTSLPDLRSICRTETDNPDFTNDRGFLFINKSAENHRILISALAIRASVINNLRLITHPF